METIRKATILLHIFTYALSSNAHPGALESGSQQWWYGYEDDSQPVLAAQRIHLTAIIGTTASLPCRVSNLRDKTVSWIRSRDLSVLAVDTITVSTDARIQVRHMEGTEDWVLEVREVRSEDEGAYECQVNTHPKTSTKIQLKVTPKQAQGSMLDMPVADTGVLSEPQDGIIGRQATRARVVGRRRVQLADGATLRLVCEVTGTELVSLGPSSHQHPIVTWTVGGFPVTSQWPHNKVLVREYWAGMSLESEMVVEEIRVGEGGVFTCNAPQATPDHVTVTVIPNRLVEAPSKLADEGYMDSSEGDGSTSAVSGSRVAVWSGAIILALLLIQAGLCVFYIKKI